MNADVPRNVIVGTAGHIDHGKSALVEALTGTHPDRLEEEKRRGITIDLGFAFLELDEIRLGFVDVPGHERFVRNMLAGVGGFDLVVLVVAADESVMPQTREHFDICRLLDIPRGLVALTKSDLVDADVLGLVRLEVEDLVRGSFLEGAPIVAVSARTGAGLDALKHGLRQVALDVPNRDPARPYRLPIDRAFAIKGFGTVVTGTLISGTLHLEDEAELLPVGQRVRVRGLQSGGRQLEQATAGMRTAVNLAGIEHSEVRRGMVLAPPGLFEPARRFDARVTLLPSARPVARRARVHLHQGTSEALAELVLLDRVELAPGDSALAQLRLREPVVVLPGDRFILRQFSPVVTIGGGVVLHNAASRHRLRDSAVLAQLAATEHGTREQVLCALLQADPRGMGLRRVLARTGWLESEARAAAQALERSGKVFLVKDAGDESLLLVAAEHGAVLEQRLRKEVESFHQKNPLAEGISKEELRTRLSRLAGPALFRAALEGLAAGGELHLAGDLVKRAGREIALSGDEAKAKEQIEQAFAKAGLAVPSLKEVLARLPVEPKRAQKLLQLLLREQVLEKISEELIFHRAALAELRGLLAKYKKERGERLPIPAFKELTGITRKYAIPLLEYLDRTRVTRRAGDERVIL